MSGQTQPLVNSVPPSLLRQLSRQIYLSVAELHQVNRSYGVCRLLLLTWILVTGGVLYWQNSHWVIAFIGLLLIGLAESALLIASHEALHGTLLALPKWEGLLSCLISWPMAWPGCTYGILHIWHHRWNSIDARDPERTVSCAKPLLRWAIGAGGIGLILTTVHQAWMLRREDTRLAWRLGYDATGIFVLHSTIVALVIAHGIFGRYLLSWIVVERIVGVILQTRALIEHWGLWQPRQNYLLSQLYGSRNVKACGWLNTVMGGLPYHSAHHAFPGIPFQHLPEASERIDKLLASYGLPAVPRCRGYLQAIKKLE